MLSGCVELPAPLGPLAGGGGEAGVDAAGGDARVDAGADAGGDARVDLGADARVDARVDGALDGGGDATGDEPDGAVSERCDGRDDDNDGIVDEAAVDAPAERCPARPWVCSDGEWGVRDDGFEADEQTCDGRDNDCDGTVDEGFAAACTWCVGQLGPPCNGCPSRIAVPAGFVCIPPGSFVMGSPDGQPNATMDEQPARRVEISRAFLMQVGELSRGDLPGGEDPSFFGVGECGERGCPVERVNGYDAMVLADRWSVAEGLPACHGFVENCRGEPLQGCDGESECEGGFECGSELVAAGLMAMRAAGCVGFRLPTEAEWEYAARAGSETRYWAGDTPDALAGVAWFAFNSGGVTHPVWERPANAWGLVGVHGNVAEWTMDGFESYGGAGRVDPWAPPGGVWVVRGGSWASDSGDCRSAARAAVGAGVRSASVGVRLVRAAVVVPRP